MLSASTATLRNRAASVLPGLATKLKARKHLAACLATGACALATALPANALTFNWSWDLIFGEPTASTGTVSGSISGLLDNQTNQTTDLIVTVDQAPNAPLGGWDNNWTFLFGRGFSVSGGVVTASDAGFENDDGDFLEFADNSLILRTESGAISNIGNPSTAIFIPQSGPGPAPVPGPLPVLGAGAAFGWSRKLRRRLKVVSDAS